MLTTTIPFMGFYETRLSDELDREEESAVDYMIEEGEHQGHDASAIHDALYFTTNYTKAHQHVAKVYAEQFAEYLKPYKLEFESMVSPREYNFTTDRIFMTISEGDFINMFGETDKGILENLILERCTSRSGFSSFYSKALFDWIEKPLIEWDHNEVGMVLEAYLKTEELDLYEVEDEIIEWMSSNGVFSNALDMAIDHEAFKERLNKQAA